MKIIAMHMSTITIAAPVVASLLLLGGLPRCQAEHSDVRFSYVDNQIVVDIDGGLMVGTSEFPVDGFFQQFTTNPGFASETDVGYGIGSFDLVAYHQLDNLLYWDGGAFATPDTNTQIRIENNGSADTLVSGSSGSQSGGFSPPVNLIGQAHDDGDFHGHVAFALEPNDGLLPRPALGAYGMKLSLTTDAAGIADSAPFMVVLNFGLDPAAFDEAVSEFAALLAPPVPGDFDGNGAVELADYDAWRASFGLPADPIGTGADGNGDGMVDAADYTIWRDHLSAAASSLSSSAHTVPEPAAAWLALIAFSTMTFHFRYSYFRGCF